MSKPFYRYPSLHILCAIGAGVLLGCWRPGEAQLLRPLGTWFVEAIRLLVGPVMFCTVAIGIASLRDLRQLGRLGLRLMIYVEVCTLLALTAGLLGAWLLEPGVGVHLPPTAAHHASAPLLATLEACVARNSVVQLLMGAIVSGIALAWMGERGRRISATLEWAGHKLFGVIRLVLKTAPLAALGAVAYAVGHYGLTSMAPLLKLIGAIYLTTIVFVMVVMGAVARWCGFSLWRYLLWIGDQLVLVLGTASSMAAMPSLIRKMEKAGCAPAVARVAIPVSYSFNLNGSCIYLTLALGFLAQAAQVELGLAQYGTILLVAMITSKASSGIAGSAFLTLSATLAAVPEIPADSLLLIVSIERLLKCRPLANVIGNGMACMAVAAWMGELNRNALRGQVFHCVTGSTVATATV
ncbi:cation:dicarboxylate symporter family transporter, partial [Duganella callida]